MDTLRMEIGDFDHIPAEKLALREQFDNGHATYSALVKGVLGAGVLVLVLHTIAFVRYTEVHANKYKVLEDEWKLFKEKLGIGKDPAGGEPARLAESPPGNGPGNRERKGKKAVATGEG